MLTLLLVTALAASYPAQPAAAGSSFTLQAATDLNAVVYGNGIYVAAGNYVVSNMASPVYNSVIMTSADGATWTMQLIFEGILIQDITYGDGIFVAVGGRCGKAAGVVLNSGDGVHWSQSSFGSNNEFDSIAYGNGRFVLTGYNASYTSIDGMNWTPIPNNFAPDTRLLFINGVFMHFGYDQVSISTDDVNWKTQDMGLIDNSGIDNSGFQSIKIKGDSAAYGDGMYAVAGTYNSGDPMGGDTPVIITSHDAVKWTMTTLSHGYFLSRITFGNGIFVAIDEDGDALTSPDGVAWTVRDTGAKGCYEIDGSANGATCTAWDPGAKTQYVMVSFCGDQFVALGGVTISISTDGMNWTNQQSNPSSITAQTPVKFVAGRDFYYMGPGSSPIFMGATPYIDDNSGRTLVPVRYLADVLGAVTSWDTDTRTITITSGGTTISMVIGSATLTVNGQAQTMDQAPVIRDGRTYLPARYVAEALGFTVSWDAGSQTVTVSQGG